MSAITIRVPNSLHDHVRKLARKDGYSVNQFFVTAAAEKASVLDAADYLHERAKRGAAERGLAILDSLPDAPPDPGDELPPELAKKFASLRAAQRKRRVRQSLSLGRRAG